jgi:hypothetical protein
MHSSRLRAVGLLTPVLGAAFVVFSIAALFPFFSGKVQAQAAARLSFANGQEPAPSAPSSTPTPTQVPADATKGAAASSGQDSSSKGKKPSHTHDFLIRGTVFQPSGMAFPSIRLRLRRDSERKFRWETFTNSRGEFAVRVPQGLQYDIVAAAKGFADQSRQVDASSGITEDNVVFRMEPVARGKKK